MDWIKSILHQYGVTEISWNSDNDFGTNGTNNDVEMLGFEILSDLWCKEVVLLEHRDRTLGQKGLQRGGAVRGREEWQIIYLGAVGSKDKEGFQRTFIC